MGNEVWERKERYDVNTVLLGGMNEQKVIHHRDVGEQKKEKYIYIHYRESICY